MTPKRTWPWPPLWRWSPSPVFITAKLFIEFLLTEEGFSPWGVDNGTYSSNPTIAVNEGDFPLEVWEPILVPEDPEYCFANRAEVEEFLNNYIY